MADRIRRAWPPPILCGAQARSTGDPCKRHAVPGAVRCTLHGGRSHPGGRAAADDLLGTRRIEALATVAVNQQMLADGWSPEVVEAIGGPHPVVRPDWESTPTADLITEDDEERALKAGMDHLGNELIRRFSAALVGLAATPPASPVLDGEVVAEPDPVAEDIRHLEARPTTKRMAKAAELRRPRERHVPTPASDDYKVAGSESTPDVSPAQATKPTREPEPRPRRVTANHLGFQPSTRRSI